MKWGEFGANVIVSGSMRTEGAMFPRELQSLRRRTPATSALSHNKALAI